METRETLGYILIWSTVTSFTSRFERTLCEHPFLAYAYVKDTIQLHVTEHMNHMIQGFSLEKPC